MEYKFWKHNLPQINHETMEEMFARVGTLKRIWEKYMKETFPMSYKEKLKEKLCTH